LTCNGAWPAAESVAFLEVSRLAVFNRAWTTAGIAAARCWFSRFFLPKEFS
jgi:hypothetical protein